MLTTQKDAVNQLPGLSDTNAASHVRVERIREVAAKLLDSTVLNTTKSRAACRDLMAAMIQLLDEEDAFHHSPPVELSVSIPIPMACTASPAPAANAPHPHSSQGTVVGASV